jgi:hypothetical protein
VRLLACWLGLVLVSVAFSARQDYYAMSCWGVAAAFGVFPWTAEQARGLNVPRWFLIAPGLLIAMAGIGALVFGAYLDHTTAGAGALAAPIAQRDTFMDALAGISPALWRELLPLFFVFGAAMAAGGIASAQAARLRWNFAAILVLAGTMAVPILLAARGFSVMSPYFSLADMARVMNGGLAQYPGARREQRPGQPEKQVLRVKLDERQPLRIDRPARAECRAHLLVEKMGREKMR